MTVLSIVSSRLVKLLVTMFVKMSFCSGSVVYKWLGFYKFMTIT